MRKNEILSIMGLLVFSIIVVNALSDVELADMYYAEAKAQYDLANCINASLFAENAYNLYAKVGNAEKASEVNDFRVSSIDKCLRDQGYAYYQQALSYYNLGGYGNYNLAKEFALKAKERYSALLFPGDLVEKCDTLIQNAEAKITANKKEQADGLYNEAYALYNQRSDFFMALKKADEAKEVYSLIDDEQGVQKCSILIDVIGIEIAQTDEQANVYYTAAEEWYAKAQENPTFSNFNKAIAYAENASRLYTIVNNTAGYSKCLSLISYVKTELSRNEERLKGEAESYYNSAELSYLEGRSKFNEGDYASASELFKKANVSSATAKQIYLELLRWADGIENAKERDQKVKYYDKKIRECKDQAEKIANEEKLISKKSFAESKYDEANNFYSLSMYENASNAVNESLTMFQSIGDWVGVSKCGALIRRIDTALGTLSIADAAYEDARSKYQSAKFDEAIPDIERAVKIYSEINRMQDIEKCENLSKKIQQGNKSKNDADKVYDDALRQYEIGSFTLSNEYAKKANKTYAQINLSSGIMQCNDLISKNNVKLAEINSREELQRNILIAAVVIVFISVLLFWQREKWKKAEARKKAMDSEDKRKEEETKKREEDKRKKDEERLRELQAERENLKKLLEEEKRKIQK